MQSWVQIGAGQFWGSQLSPATVCHPWQPCRSGTECPPQKKLPGFPGSKPSCSCICWMKMSVFLWAWWD